MAGHCEDCFVCFLSRAPHLVAVLVGGDPASQTYVSNKTKAAEKCGMKATTLCKDSATSQETLLDLVKELNLDPEVDGILMQLPLPPHVDEQTVMQSISPAKDVDGFHVENIGKYCSGNPGSALIPATPLGVLEIIKRCNVPTFGKTVCIANRSKNIGGCGL
jgi:5,10-methylene-tetrahydrofolate dehydrogenase/methenyl tetrahydrofolate cyclohydrolase